MAAGLGQALWFAALLVLMRTLFGRGAPFLIAAAASIVMDSFYGGMHEFSYGETFATPRLFAEALVMTALAAGLTRRFVPAGISLLAAAALHPIMALTGMGFLAVLLALQDRRLWILIGGAVAVGLGLAFLGVAPFDRVLSRFDDAWFHVVEPRCAFAFLSWWSWLDFLRLAAVYLVLGGAWIMGSKSERGPVLVAMLTGAAALAVTFVGADLAHNILVVNAQPWRMLWLATLLANAWLGLLAWRAPKGSLSRELLVAAALLSVFSSFFALIRLAAAIVVILAVGVMLLERRRKAPAALRIATRVLLVFAVWYAGYAIFFQSTAPDYGLILAGLGTCLGLLALGAWLIHRRAAARGASAALFALLAAGCATVDHRTDWIRFVETPTAPEALEAFVGGDQNLYWPDSVDLMWFKLRMPSYYSCSQGTGSMFFRGTAMEYQRRTDALRPLNTADFRFDDRDLCPAKAEPHEDGPRSAAQLATACKALPELDAVVLPKAVPGAAAAAIWRAPAGRPINGETSADGRREVRLVTHYYKYACADLRGAEPRT